MRTDPREEQSPAERLEHRLQPWSAGLVVPLFAFTAAGVALSSDLLRGVVTNPVGRAIALGLVLVGVDAGEGSQARRGGAARISGGVTGYA